MMLHTKYQGSRPSGSRQEDFFHVFPMYTFAIHVTHLHGAIFGHRGIIFYKLGRGPLGVATYQIIWH